MSSIGLQLRTACPCKQPSCCRHSALAAPTISKQATNLFLTSATALLCLLSCSTARVATHLPDALADPCPGCVQHQRSLLQETPVGFLDHLAGEEPTMHLEELYLDSGSTLSRSDWLVEAVGASAEDEDHDEHGDEHGDEHDDHAGETEAEHAAHAGETEAEHAAHAGEDDHAGLGGEETVLTGAALAGLRMTGDSDAAFFSRIAPLVLACQADPGCTIESTVAAEEAGVAISKGKDDLSDLVGLKVGLAVAFFVLTIAGSIVPQVFKNWVHSSGVLTLFNVFSGAVFLTVGITHLLPHVLEYQEEANLDTKFPVGLALAVIGYLLILLVERVIFDVHHLETPEIEPKSPRVVRQGMYRLLESASSSALRHRDPLITEAAVTVHAVLECIILGVAQSRRDTLIFFLAITSHKFFAAVSLGTRFVRVANCSPRHMTILLMPYHLLPPLATIISAVLAHGSTPLANMILSGLATGTFLYVGAFEVTAEEFGAHDDYDGSSASEGSSAASDPESQKSGIPVKPWQPTRLVKWLVMLAGVATLMSLTLAIPEGDAHNH